MTRARKTPDTFVRRASADDYRAAPLEVFYVVETTGQVEGERKHHVSSPLFETQPQASRTLAQLRATNPAAILSIWKGATYIEPAQWSYDVVMADGTVIPALSHPAPIGNALSPVCG